MLPVLDAQRARTIAGQRPGYTYAELVFTLVIVALVLAIALGSRPTSIASDADRAAILLQRHLQMARTDAVTNGQLSRVTFETDSSYSRWTMDSSGSLMVADAVVLPDDIVFSVGSASRGPMGDPEPVARPEAALECDESGSCGVGVASGGAPVSAIYIASVRDPNVVRAVVQTHMGMASLYRYDHATGAWQ